MRSLMLLFLLVSVATATHFAGFSLEASQDSSGLNIFATSTWSCGMPRIIFGADDGSGHQQANAYSFAVVGGALAGCQTVAAEQINFYTGEEYDNNVVNSSGYNVLQDVVAFGGTWAQLSRSFTVAIDAATPSKFSFAGAARISSLQEDNGNTGWNIEGYQVPASNITRTPYMFNPGRIFLAVDQAWQMPAPVYAGYSLYAAVVGDIGGLTTALPDGMEFNSQTGMISWTPTVIGTYAVQFAFVAADNIKVKTTWEVQFQVLNSLISSPTVTFDSATNVITATKNCESDTGNGYCHIFSSASSGAITPLDGMCMQDNSTCTRRFLFTPPADTDDFRALPCFYAAQPDPTTDIPTGWMMYSNQWSALECLTIEIGNPNPNVFVEPPVDDGGFLVIQNCMGCETDCGAPHRGECDTELCGCVCRHPFTSEGQDQDDCAALETDC